LLHAQKNTCKRKEVTIKQSRLQEGGKGTTGRENRDLSNPSEEIEGNMTCRRRARRVDGALRQDRKGCWLSRLVPKEREKVKKKKDATIRRGKPLLA